MRASDLATGAPAWVYILLAGLIFLGVRRLRTREVPVAVALLPSIAFLLWSVTGAWMFAAIAGGAVAGATWLGGAVFGVASTALIVEPRGERLQDGRVRLPATAVPLVLYLAVFGVRFACGAWAAIVPADRVLATGIGVAISAAMTARLVMAVRRWHTPATGFATA